MQQLRVKNFVQQGLVILLLLALSYGYFSQYPPYYFRDLIYNQGWHFNAWDFGQLLLGYYRPTSTEQFSYLELRNLTQIFLPLLFQLFGLISCLSFLRLPRSYQTFVRTRTSSRWQLMRLELKPLCWAAWRYALTTGLSFVLASWPARQMASTFDYQKGSFGLACLGYFSQLALMLLAVALFILLMMFSHHLLAGLSLSLLGLLGLNLLDRAWVSVNVVLFDAKHFFLDGLAFWLVLLLFELFVFYHMPLTQEEYND